MTDTAEEITAELVVDPLREQHADLADLPLAFGACGRANQLWRLGDELAVRVPWHTDDAELRRRRGHLAARPWLGAGQGARPDAHR